MITANNHKTDRKPLLRAASLPLVLVLILSALALGCAHKATMRYQWPDKPLAVKDPAEAMVYGRFVMTVDGTPVPFKKSAWPVVDLRFFHTETAMWTKPVYIEKDGSFYMVLNKGTHILSPLTGLVNRELFSPEGRTVDPHAMLEMDDEKAVIFYAGTITITVESSKVTSITVNSEAKEATTALLKRNPEIHLVQAPSVALLYHDPSIIAPPEKAPPDPEREKKLKTLKMIGTISLEIVGGMASAFSGF